MARMNVLFKKQPHFVRDYRRVVANFLHAYPLDEAMARAVGGGGYDDNGKIECDALIAIGLTPGDSVIDIGCGSGRLSTQLSRRASATPSTIAASTWCPNCSITHGRRPTPPIAFA
jgi:2-polyprenyl-3-methyl-5-hydroxy-6-metoxy-1,4-benzoquinol methylase